MVIRWSSAVLTRHLAPEITAFTSCDAPDLTLDNPQANHWIANHFLNSVFRGQFRGTYRQFVLNLLYRAQIAFQRYHSARALTLEFLESSTPGSPAVRKYFQALSDWESSLLNFQIFIDILNRMENDAGGTDVFADGDGSPEQRAYALANSIKHWGSDLAKGRHSDEHTVPVWLTNSGFQSRSHQLTFQELGELIGDIARLANEMQDPSSMFPKSDAKDET